MRDLRTITVPASLIPARAHYQRHVIEHGHRPGVLSGAELAGKARSHAGCYARSRRAVEQALTRFGVRSGYALVNSRLCRVWLCDGTGDRVRLELQPHTED